MAMEKQIIKCQRILSQEEIKLCEKQKFFFWAAVNYDLEVKIHFELNHFGFLLLQSWRTDASNILHLEGETW